VSDPTEDTEPPHREPLSDPEQRPPAEAQPWLGVTMPWPQISHAEPPDRTVSEASAEHAESALRRDDLLPHLRDALLNLDETPQPDGPTIPGDPGPDGDRRSSRDLDAPSPSSHSLPSRLTPGHPLPQRGEPATQPSGPPPGGPPPGGPPPGGPPPGGNQPSPGGTLPRRDDPPAGRGDTLPGREAPLPPREDPLPRRAETTAPSGEPPTAPSEAVSVFGEPLPRRGETSAPPSDPLPQREPDQPQRKTATPFGEAGPSLHGDDLPQGETGTPVPETPLSRPEMALPWRGQDLPRRETELAQPDTALPRRGQDLPQREADLPRREHDLPEREATLPRRGQDLPQPETGLPQPETTLPRRGQDLPQREAELGQPETTLPRRGQELPQRETGLPQRGQDLPQRGTPLPRRTSRSRPAGRHRSPHRLTVPSDAPSLVLAIPGVPVPATVELAEEIAAAVRMSCPGVDVRVGYLAGDAQQLDDALLFPDNGSGEFELRAVIVPVLAGPHPVLDAVLADAADRATAPVMLAAHLGPHPLLAEALHARLADAGLARAGRARGLSIVTGVNGVLVLADRGDEATQAAGVSAVLLAARLAVPATPASLGDPAGLNAALARLREAGAIHPVIAPCIIGPESPPHEIEAIQVMLGAPSAPPLGAHPAVGQLAAMRYGAALTRLAMANSAG
jgi:hypothetical protein